jgi:4-alpha-glucanotransferase
MFSSESQLRRAGVLLHPTSLPSGILDSDVERWLQLISDTGCSIWQVLPLGEPQSGLSPYQCSSAFAFNPQLLPESSPQFSALDIGDAGYIEFCKRQQFWLDDYALFEILKQHFNEAAWIDWPKQWKSRDLDALQDSRVQYQQAIVEIKWHQFQLHKRWAEVRDKASELGILLFGDMPIFIGHDSADVWSHPEYFLLDSDGKMEVVSGVPPDYFSETGQRWGNPHYDWDIMREDDFSWWKSRVDHHLEQFDLVRIDHFRGMEAAWMINASCETAVDGHWQQMPGDELLASLQAHLRLHGEPVHGEHLHKKSDQLPFVAEDLGIITPEVTALRKKYHLPGMSILQFGFDAFDDNPHKLKNIEEDKIVYTGTHDNDTTKGWFNSLDDNAKNQVLQSLGLLEENVSDWRELSAAEDQETIADTDKVTGVDKVADRVVERMIDGAMQSRAAICIIPLQDCLHLGTEARMNIPGTIDDNWQWQFQWQQISREKMQQMRELVKRAGRSVHAPG